MGWYPPYESGGETTEMPLELVLPASVSVTVFVTATVTMTAIAE